MKEENKLCGFRKIDINSLEHYERIQRDKCIIWQGIKRKNE